MRFSEFQKSLDQPHSVYVVVSTQDLFLKRVYDLCREQVAESARDFDWSVFDLEQDPVGEVVQTARTLPWVSKRRWVYVRDHAGSGSGLKTYLARPAPRTVLILETRKRSRAWSRLPRIEFDKKVGPARWLRAWAKQEGYVLEPAATRALVELVGDDLGRLRMELEKQFLAQWESRKITSESVAEMTLESREYDVFNLIGAMAKGQSSTALLILNRLFEKGVGFPQILAMLYWTFRRLLVAREMLDRGRSFQEVLRKLKIWSYRGREGEVRRYSPDWIRQILIRIRETDRACKSGVSEPRYHLERLLIDTCRRGQL